MFDFRELSVDSGSFLALIELGDGAVMAYQITWEEGSSAFGYSSGLVGDGWIQRFPPQWEAGSNYFCRS